MKKFVPGFCALLVALFAVSCSGVIIEPVDEETPGTTDVSSAGKIVFDIKVNHPASETKAVKSGWETGDIVYVFFNNVEISDTPKYATLTRTADGWDAAFSDGWDGTGLEASGATMSAVYFPFSSGTVQIAKDGDSYSFRADDPFQWTDAPIFTYYLQAEKADYTISVASGISTLSGTLDMQIPSDFVQFYLARDADKYHSNGRYRLSVRCVHPVACSAYIPAGTFSRKAKSDGQPLPGYVYGDGVLFSGEVNLDSYYGWTGTVTPPHRRVILFDTENSALTATFDKPLSGHSAINISSSVWTRAVQEPEKVDLGMVVGGKTIYWADRNLGADTPSDFGFYFAWGDVVPWSGEDVTWVIKQDGYYGQDSYAWCDWIDYYSHPFIKYTSATPLDASDDAATAFLGPDWRMPTADEITALTALSWTDGWVVKDGKNVREITAAGNSLYLPASGYRHGLTAGSGSVNHYWSKSQHPDWVIPYMLLFESSTQTLSAGPQYGDRFSAGSIRPVRE